ncbi:hypothetical protein COL83_26950 [Bacillus wiedmannii]|nr:hypothetical protein COL83_26950 [Bacillus wiedmannii]
MIGKVLNLSCAGGQSEWHEIFYLNSMDIKFNEYTQTISRALHVKVVSNFRFILIIFEIY